MTPNEPEDPTAADSGAAWLFVIAVDWVETSAFVSMLDRLPAHDRSSERSTAQLGSDGLSREGSHAGNEPLSAFNDKLYSILDASSNFPPDAGPGWQHHRRVRAVREGAIDLVRRAPFAQPVVWQDPRNCFLLPFWRDVLNRPCAGVLVYRHPLDFAVEFRRANGGSLSHGIALWEQATRAAIGNIQGLPALVVPHAGIHNAPEEWAGIAASFLRCLEGRSDWSGAGVPESLESLVEVAGAESSGALLPSQRDLFESLSRSNGIHTPWVSPPVPEPSIWVTDLISARRESHTTWSALEWAIDAVAALAQTSPSAQEKLSTPSSESQLSPNAARDEARYHEWIETHESQQAYPPGRSEAKVNESVKFSVVVPVYRPNLEFLERCIDSVTQQSYANWELCICDDGSQDALATRYLERASQSDRRIKVVTLEKNAGISAATNEALGIASGDFVGFLDHDDELAPTALATVFEALQIQPEGDVIYSDEDKLDRRNVRVQPFFKPDWSPDLLLSLPYMTHFLVVRRTLVEEAGRLRSDFDGSQDYDLMLRVTERTRNIVHIPRVLYHWRAGEGSAAGNPDAKPWAHSASRKALAAALERRGIRAVIEPGPGPGWYHVVREVTEEPLVSVIIPFRDEAPLLRRCIDSLFRKPGYENWEVLLVDNGSSDVETELLVDQLGSDQRITVLSRPGPFNWSAINNEAASLCDGELLLFLNNDIEALSDSWLSILVGHTTRAEVGAVGARLLYLDDRVQHAGVVLGVGGIASHMHRNLPARDPGYFGSAKVTRNCTAVTGACMMTRREIFTELEGFDTSFATAFNDIDFCMRLREAGSLVVYCPLAEFVHYESRSRGFVHPLEQDRRFFERWPSIVREGDPYFNPNLSRMDPNFVLPTRSEEQTWKKILSTLESSSKS